MKLEPVDEDWMAERTEEGMLEESVREELSSITTKACSLMLGLD